MDIGRVQSNPPFLLPDIAPLFCTPHFSAYPSMPKIRFQVPRAGLCHSPGCCAMPQLLHGLNDTGMDLICITESPFPAQEPQSRFPLCMILISHLWCATGKGLGSASRAGKGQPGNDSWFRLGWHFSVHCRGVAQRCWEQ